jgi:hypothetical protein
MLAAHKEPDHYNRYLALAVDRVAVDDPEAARGMLDGFRSGSSFYQHEGRMFLAYRLATKDPDGAAKLVAGVTEPHYRALGYVTLARITARTDRPRAWSLIDAALTQLAKDATGFDSWSGSGGWPAVAAVVATAAREFGHPDPSAGVVLALARRPVDRSELRYRDDQLVSIALALSFVDPPTARRVLAGVAPPDQFADRAVTARRDWVFAVALVLPELAPAVIDRRLKHHLDQKAGPEGVSRSGLVELTHTLTAADRYRDLAGWASVPRVNTEWEE